MAKIVWVYERQCPVCRKRVAYVASAGVTPETPEASFETRCVHCSQTIQLDASMLAQRESSDGL